MHRRASEVPAPRFTFVRHPLDRLVSAWHFARQSYTPALHELGKLPLREFMASDHLLVFPQTYWIDAPVEFIGRFENLHADFAKISDAELPHLERSEHGPWFEYIGGDLRGAAIDRYYSDFVTFGYEVP